jgi:hypothetical protein
MPLSVRAVVAERWVEPVRRLAPPRLAPEREPLDLLDLEPPDLVAMNSSFASPRSLRGT